MFWLGNAKKKLAWVKLMASIIKKKIKGQIYYYAAESKRVNGKPRIVWQKYLGKVGDIVEAVSSSDNLPVPKSAKVYSFGAEAALLGIARRLDAKEIINKHTGPVEDGFDVGEYILIQAINNCTEPGAKIADWFAGTVLRRHFSINPKMLTEKRFWEVAELLTEDVLSQIQTELAGRIHAEFGVGTRSLIYHDVKLPGHIVSKAPKDVLTYPGIGLLVSSDFFVPLFYEIYQAGFRNSSSVKKYTDKLIESYRGLGRTDEDITVVKHLCSNPEEITPGSSETSYRVLGLLAKDDNEELLGISLDRFHPLKDYRQNKVKVYRSSKKISGENTTVLIVFSEKEMTKQLEAVKSNLRKCVKELVELKACLQIRKVDEEAEDTILSLVEKRVEEILNKPFLKSMVHVSFAFDEGGRVNLDFTVNDAALSPVQERNLGKWFIFTTNNNWDNEEIYSAFKGRSELEEFLGAIKKRVPGSIHGSQKELMRRRVDVFYTILGLTLQTLLRRELQRYGIKGSIPEIFKTLSEIHEVAVIYTREDQRVKKREYITISQLDPKQKEIYECLQLHQFEAGG